MKIAFPLIPFAVMLFCGFASAQEPQDLKDFPACKYCSMNRAQYAHSRVLVVYDDGTQLGACSIYCAAVDLAINLDKSPTAIRVGDYYSKELIDAETAYWVIGGIKIGVMTKRGKWAFLRKTVAERFISENGGKMATFEEALKATYEDMFADSKMIRSKRKIRNMQN
jgi:copper chaperone NosL